MGRILFVFLFLFSFNSVFGQGLSCDQAEPFCAGGSTLVFQNTYNGFPGAQPNAGSETIDFSCSASGGPSNGTSWLYPVWYYLRIDSDGDLTFTISQTVNADGTGAQLDVDFVAWGPFSSSNVHCGVDLTNANKVDCSYLPATVENMTITGAQEGEIYVVMISNYSQTQGFITVEQTNIGGGSAGSTDCSIVNTDTYCEGDMTDLDATTPSAVSYEWFQDGNPLAETGPILMNVVAPSATYTTNALDNLGSVIATYEFNLNFEPVPIAFSASNMLQCDDDNDGELDFDLNSQNAQIIGSQDSSLFRVTYHLNQADADNNTNALTSPFQNTSNPQTIYARIENNNLADCFDTTSFIIEVFDTPIANVVPDQLICDDNNDGSWDFNLTNLDATVLVSQNATDFAVTYHISQSDAETNSNAITSPYTNITNPETIFVRIENNLNTDCFDTTSFNVEVFDTPTANTVPNQLICDDDNDGFWALDVNSLSTIVLGSLNAADYTVTYHNSQPDADSNTNAITSPYTNAAAYQQEEIFVRIENNLNTDCFDTTSFMFDVFDTPTAETVTYDLCDDNLDGDDTNGIVTFDLNSITDQVLGTQDSAQFNVTYHLDQADADSGANDLPFSYDNQTANSQQIIARVENIDNTDCFETAIIDLVVYELPTVTPIVELFQCDDDADGFVDFNLTEAEELISTNHLNENFTYYTTLADAENDLNAITDPAIYTNTDSSAAADILFVRIVNADGCYRTSQLNLLVSTTAIDSTFHLSYNLCDNTDVDGDDRNGIVTFDFSDAEMLIRDLFPPGQLLTISYYESIEDALAEINAIPDVSNHRNEASPHVQNIYVRVDSDLDNACLGLGHHITLQVDALPVFTISNESLVCVNVNGTGQAEFPPLDTGLSTVDYSFEWSLDGNLLPLETDSTLLPTVGGTYSVLVTNNTTGCSDTDMVTVSESSPPVISAEVTSLPFADDHIIEVTATGLGTYEFSLNDGAWQESNIFENVAPGYHIVHARDTNGCGTDTTTVLVVDYPVYFTPNGDGNNDTWDIVGVETLLEVEIHIFDRYGKLLKQLNPLGNGWDGTLNGVTLPTNDYWFIIEYNEPIDGIRKQFRAHFTLKR